MQGAGLQMCRNTSKGGNDAMSIYTRSETDLDYIRQAELVIISLRFCIAISVPAD